MAAGVRRSARWMSWFCLVVGIITVISQVAFWAGIVPDSLPLWLERLRNAARWIVVPLGLMAVPLGFLNVIFGLVAFEKDLAGRALTRTGVILSAMALSFGPLVITAKYFTG